LLVGKYSYFPDDRGLFNGWVAVGDLPYKFTTAIAGMSKGNISKPIETDFGLHIIQLKDRKRDSVNIGEILLSVFPSFDAFQKVSNEAWKLVKELRDTESLDIPEKYDVKYISYGENEYPNLPVNFGTFLSDIEEGKVSYPLIGEDGFYVCWIEEKEEGIPSFADIEEEVKDSLMSFEAARRARDYALKTFTGDKLPRNPEKGKWGRTSYFTLKTFENVNIPEKVAFLAFSVRQEGLFPPVRAGESLFIIKIIDFKMPGTEELHEIVPKIAARLQMEKEGYFFQKWYSEQREGYNVLDVREKIYE
jgi:hypothetical protein